MKKLFRHDFNIRFDKLQTEQCLRPRDTVTITPTLLLYLHLPSLDYIKLSIARVLLTVLVSL